MVGERGARFRREIEREEKEVKVARITKIKGAPKIKVYMSIRTALRERSGYDPHLTIIKTMGRREAS